MSRRHDEAGFVGGFEALPFGFLVFVVGSLLLVNAWAVFDCHMAASAAAREAVRAFVEANGADSRAQQSGYEAAIAAIEGQGKDVGRMDLTWSGASLVRCQAVVATVRYEVPIFSIPWIASFGGGGIDVSARHSEVVDPLRTGLPTDGFEPEACGA